MKIDLIRFAGNFSLTESALSSVGRQDVFRFINDAEGLERSRRPILAIPAGGPWNFYPKPPDPAHSGFDMIEKALAAIPKSANFEICIDCAGEGLSFYGEEHDLMTERFSQWGFDPTRTYLLTSRIDAEAAYQEWCQLANRRPILKPLYTPAQLYYVAGQYRSSFDSLFLQRLVGERSPIFAPRRKKKFLCLNYSPREARWATVLHLMSQELLDQGLYSFYGRSVDNGPNDASPNLDFIIDNLTALRRPTFEKALVHTLDLMTPVTLDDPNADRGEKAYGLAVQDFYKDTYFSIVTESDFISQAGSRFTEKVLKPMINLHPFVLIGTVGVLGELRRLGFKTFSPYINEAYDSIEDHGERLSAALATATTLIRMPVNELHDLYAELWPILVHNMTHLLGGAPSLVDKDVGLQGIAAKV